MQSKSFLIRKKYLLSFLKSDWTIDDYPVWIKDQESVSPEYRYSARIYNWPALCGLGADKEKAYKNLEEDLNEIKVLNKNNNEPMPRPGCKVPIKYATAERMNSDPELRDEFITEILQIELNDFLFISDSSRLEYFADDDGDVEKYKNRILQRYGVKVKESLIIADIIQQIKDSKK